MVLLRKQFELPDSIEAAHALVTCDNGFELYLNGKRIASGENFQKPNVIDLSKHIMVGENTLIAVAKNGGGGPNPAGFFFHARFQLSDATEVVIQSDESWRFHPDVPKERDETITEVSGGWKPITVVSSLSVWTNAVASAREALMAAMTNDRNQSKSMVRASLLKNTALMKSLGRPMREQIVSMRPDTITTLEAIDLANEASLAASFAKGAEQLIASKNGDVDSIIQTLFQSALARAPVDREFTLMRDLLGTEPSPSAVQDAMWAVCMLPEYILIR